MGGTLRYREEICYVFLICTDEDSGPLKKYPTLQLNYEKIPRVNVIHLVTFAPEIGYFDWENFTFALYYPTNQNRLICPSDKISYTKITVVLDKGRAVIEPIHHEQQCLAKVFCGTCGKFRCPDHSPCVF